MIHKSWVWEHFYGKLERWYIVRSKSLIIVAKIINRDIYDVEKFSA